MSSVKDYKCGRQYTAAHGGTRGQQWEGRGHEFQCIHDRWSSARYWLNVEEEGSGKRQLHLWQELLSHLIPSHTQPYSKYSRSLGPCFRLSLQCRNAPTLHFTLPKHAQSRDTDWALSQHLPHCTVIIHSGDCSTWAHILRKALLGNFITVQTLQSLTQTQTATSLGRYQKADIRKWVILKDHHCICGPSLREIPLHSTWQNLGFCLPHGQCF